MAEARAETGLVLPGGGARAAYQVGALRAIARVLPARAAQPFPVICGTSAGAINAAVLASNADSFRRGVARLVRWWRAIAVTDVYRADFVTLMRHGTQLLASLGGGGLGPERATSLLDNTPLRRLLATGIDAAKIHAHVDAGNLHAVAINATSYGSGHAVTFYDGAPELAPWHRVRRRGARCALDIDHVMASAAIPLVFPAVRLGDDYYMDGSVRQMAPLAPALHLGAARVVAVAIGQFTGQAVTSAPPRYPSLGQIAGHALSSVFLDNLGADLERLYAINRIAAAAGGRAGAEARHVDALVLAPSTDLGALAVQYAHRLPRGVRYLLRGLGSTHGTGSNLLSYLLFDREYCRALMRVGYADAMARREEIVAFLADGAARLVPLLPAEWR
ncbi:MAG TPA: patatin-like phospholipase family protein [Casimicrobiaceae bacterium]|nr:patatin-like phospholipase family protein [Casimicrobiaceae bacterium]